MDVRDYLRIFRRYWWVVVVVTVIGAGLGYASNFVCISKLCLTPKYRSTATLFVATQNGTSVSEVYQNNLFSQERVVSYAGLATSEQVATRAVNQLKAPISAEDLRKKISAKPQDKTVLLDVNVKDANPAQAQVYANAVAQQLVGLIAELETSRRGGTPAAGAVIVDDATYPTSPVNLTWWKRIALGAGGSFVLGLVVALLIGVLDRRLRGREPVEAITGALVLGALPGDPTRPDAGVVDLTGSGLYAERIRQLRTNLRFTKPPGGDLPPRSIVVTSPSPEDGRTTTAIDLAAALAEAGRSVVLVDGDLRHPALADRLSLDKRMRDRAVQSGLSTVLVGEHELAEALIAEVPVGDHSIAFLPAGPEARRPGELWATDRASTLFEELAKDFEYAIVDTPALATYADGAMVGALCDGAIVLARVSHTTTNALRRAIQTLQTANVWVIGAVVTFEPVSLLQARRHRKENGRITHPSGPQDSAEEAHERRPAARSQDGATIVQAADEPAATVRDRRSSTAPSEPR